MKSEPGLLLSDIIVTPLELGKIQRELFALDEFLSAESHGKSSGSSLPYKHCACSFVGSVNMDTPIR